MSDDIEIIDLRECHFRVSNHIFDQELSVYELGVYICLCRFANNQSTESFPSITKLQNMLRISRPKVINSLKILVKEKLVHKKQGFTGKSNRYYLLDIPSKRHLLVNTINQGSKPHLPTSKPSLPEVVNDVYPIKTNIKRLSKKTKEKDMVFEIPSSLKACKEFEPTWKTWLTYRQELRKKVTPTMALAQLAKMEKMGAERSISMIKHTIEKGWQGLYEPDNYNNNSGVSKQERIFNKLHGENNG